MKTLTLAKIDALRLLVAATDDHATRIALANRLQRTMVDLIVPPRRLPHQEPTPPKKLKILWI